MAKLIYHCIFRSENMGKSVTHSENVRTLPKTCLIFLNMSLNSFFRRILEGALLFFDLFIILLWFFIILYCRSLEKVRTHFQKQSWGVHQKIYLSNQYSTFIGIQNSHFRKSCMANRVYGDCFWTVLFGR